MYGDSKKQRLIHLAGSLQNIVDELLDCAKEHDSDDDEDDKDKKESVIKMKAVKLSKALGDY